MDDEQQLRAILRRLDRPTDPDPAFADALFAQLAGSARARRTRTPFVLLAAALLVALLAAGAVEDHGALMAIQHAGMFTGMFLVMLLRLDEYTGHGRHAHAAA